MAVRINRSPYTVSPRGTGRQLMSLGRVLLKYTPPNPPAIVEQAAERLDVAVAEGRNAYADRIRNSGPLVAGMDREDDGFADSVLAIARVRLEHWRLFERPTFNRLAPADPAEHEALARKAERAGELLRRLFSTEFDATRAPYAEQGEYMLTLELMIDQGGLADDLIDLLGAPYYSTLRRTIRHYKDMVDRRQSGDNVEANLREVNGKLQYAIQDYMIALLATLRDDDPDSVAQVRRALGPVDAFRASFGGYRTRSGDDSSVVDDALDSAAVEALVAEQQALDAELGVVEGSEPDEAEFDG